MKFHTYNFVKHADPYSAVEYVIFKNVQLSALVEVEKNEMESGLDGYLDDWNNRDNVDGLLFSSKIMFIFLIIAFIAHIFRDPEAASFNSPLDYALPTALGISQISFFYFICIISSFSSYRRSVKKRHCFFNQATI
jgi:hypothetical protein